MLEATGTDLETERLVEYDIIILLSSGEVRLSQKVGHRLKPVKTSADQSLRYSMAITFWQPINFFIGYRLIYVFLYKN